MRRWFWLLLTTAALALGLGACHGGDHHEFVVDSPADEGDAAPGDAICEAHAGVGDCTLRAALDEANALTAVGSSGGTLAAMVVDGPQASAPPSIVVDLQVDVTLSLSGAGEDQNATGDLDIAADVTIEGNGHTIDAARIDRAIDVRAGNVTLQSLTIANGLASNGQDGGGLRTASGTGVFLSRSTISRSTATGPGICVRSTEFPQLGCSVFQVGGGSGVASDGRLTVLLSTIDANFGIPVAPSGEPVFTCQPVMAMQELCPISFGGGILARGPLVVVDSTFSANNSFEAAEIDSGSAVYATASPSAIWLSTFVDNRNDLRSPVNGAEVHGSLLLGTGCGAPVAEGDHNLVSGPCPGSPGAPTTLGPLADNGGSTATHLPLATSPAVDAIPWGTPLLCDGSLAIDQRDRPRPVGGACDIGAVERQPDDA